MPGNVLTDDLGFQCSHAGGVTVTGSARLCVEGHSVLTNPEILAAVFDGTCTNTGGNLTPCSKCSSSSAGTKLRIDGALAVLADFSTVTNSVPPGTITIVASSPPHARMRSV